MKMLVIGHGRHGKDTFCELARDEFEMSFSSSSQVMCENEFIQDRMRSMGVEFTDGAHLFSVRHQHREKLAAAITAYMESGNSLVSEIFAVSDIYCGARRPSELKGAKIDLIVYIDAHPRLPRNDVTMEIPIESSDAIISNSTSLEDFLNRSRRFLSAICKKSPV